MKRRHILQAALGAPAIPALVAQQRQSAAAQGAGAAVEYPNIEVAGALDVAEPNLHFFTPTQYEVLTRLAEIITPSLNGNPGAVAAGAPAFLDFLLGESSADRQQLYRAGLDKLNRSANQRHKVPFSKLPLSDAEALLAPLREPWTFDPPADPFARFLHAAKHDIRTATMNSRELAAAGASSRRGGGLGQYWLPLD